MLECKKVRIKLPSFFRAGQWWQSASPVSVSDCCYLQLHIITTPASTYIIPSSQTHLPLSDVTGTFVNSIMDGKAFSSKWKRNERSGNLENYMEVHNDSLLIIARSQCRANPQQTGRGAVWRVSQEMSRSRAEAYATGESTSAGKPT